MIAVDIIARRLQRSVAVVAAPQAAPLLGGDSRVERVALVHSSHPLIWRAEVLCHLVRAKLRGETVVNLEVYSPRWEFLRHLAAVLDLEASHLDLVGLLDDNRRSARGQTPALPHRAHYYSRAAGLDAGEPPLPELRVSADAVGSVETELRSLRLPAGSSTVVVHPGSSEERRRAPVALLAPLLREVASVRPINVLVVGTETERPLSEKLRDALAPGVSTTDWTGRRSLPELAALLAKAALFIGGDSGPLKIAEAVGTRTLSLWAATGGSFAGPRGLGHRMVQFDSPVSHGVAAALELLASPRPTAGVATATVSGG